MARKIGIVGKGNAGSALARGLARAGYDVRSAGKDAEAVNQLGAWADLVVLAVPYSAEDEALSELGATIAGKTVVDVVNPLTQDMKLAVGHTTSEAEELQRKVPKAKVVKAFNSIVAKHMETGHVNGEQLTAFVAGDDARAKAEVLELARALGFDPVDAGPLSTARALEPLAFLNVQLGFGQKMGYDIGFKFVHAT